MGYTPSFTPQYENGWEDLPSETSPITAEALNAYDDAIENIEEYLASDESQGNLADAYDETATYEAGDYVIYGGDLYKCLEDIDTPEEWDSTKWESCLITNEMGHGGGGSNVSITPTLSTGTKIADFEIDGQTGELYAPTGGGGNANIWTGTQAELEEVFDELEEGTQINITDDEQEVVEGGTIYSENEQVIGLWTDNKSLYQKTITITNASISGNATIDVTQQLSSLEINDLVDYGVTITCDSAGHTYNYHDTSLARISIEDDSTYSIALSVSSGTITNLVLNATLKYTKTIDAPIDVVVGKKTMYIASSDCYSTEEKEVGCAPNGKPLYQKTILHENPFTGSESLQTIAHGISNFDEAVSITGFIYDAHESTPSWMPMPRFYTSNAFGISHVTTSDIYIYIPSAFGTRLRNARITIQYTKTTDTAGSGQYTPASGKAVHYSTDEQVIGTWIDGSTLYRKTIHKANISVVNGTEIAHGISNLAMCTKLDVICYDESGVSFPFMAIGSQYADSASERSMGFRINATNFVAYGKNEFTAQTTRHWYFTVEYTKSV